MSSSPQALRPAKTGKSDSHHQNRQQILRWCRGHRQYKTTCVLRNLLFQQLWVTKSQRQCVSFCCLTSTEARRPIRDGDELQRQCPENHVFIPEATDCPIHFVRAQLHLTVQTDPGFSLERDRQTGRQTARQTRLSVIPGHRTVPEGLNTVSCRESITKSKHVLYWKLFTPNFSP